MKKRTIFLIWLVIIFPLNYLPSFGSDLLMDIFPENTSDLTFETHPTPEVVNPVQHFVSNFAGISQEAMKYALSGYAALNEQGKILKKDLITIVDFSKPSTEERLFVIDLKTKKILAKSLVAHGKNSGVLMAEKFSNAAESYTSSLGFYIASETYNGKHGYSLKLDGMETGFNDKARERGVVVHAADYVSKAFIQATGRLGRSQGCPALPPDQYQQIISMIKGGSCFFIYHPDKQYLTHSPVLKSYSDDCLAEVITSLN